MENEEKSRIVKMCYASYRLIVMFFLFIILLIVIFMKDFSGDQIAMKILRQIKYVEKKASNASQTDFI